MMKVMTTFSVSLHGDRAPKVSFLSLWRKQVCNERQIKNFGGTQIRQKSGMLALSMELNQVL